MKITYRLFLLAFLPGLAAYGQNISWWNPGTAEFRVIEGQAWPDEVRSRYDRLPARYENEVREPVWRLSTQSAGLMIRFRSNASQIQVRYQVTGSAVSFPHMPSTGVSGIDLYAVSSDGEQLWCTGKYAFKDTIQYTFTNLVANDRYHQKGREYRLYLPLYNGVKWLEIGVPDSSTLTPLPVRPDKPIVIYGTSIAQGACASRPGMAWTTILGRKLDRPVINLGFSGNGRLENPIIELMTTLDPKIYVLDCLPNLVDPKEYPDQEVKKRLQHAVRELKAKRPHVPIALAEHAGYTEAKMNASRRQSYERLNNVLRQTYAELKAEGVAGLYLVPQSAFGQDIETMVDGTHPSDLGMMLYATGYEKALREILAEPKGSFSTTIPCTQLRELNGYDWEDRHREMLELNRKDPPRTVLMGNSITHFWGGLPGAYRRTDAQSWEETFGKAGVRNMGYGWDRIENVLWRIYHGELDGYAAERIFVMIGTNNLQGNTDEEIIAGWRLLIEAIRLRQPTAKLYMTAIFPRRNQEDRVRSLNIELSALAGKYDVGYIDPGRVLLDQEGKIQEKLFSDGLHPNAEGYRTLGKAYRTALLR